MSLNAALTDSTQVVEVEFQARGKTLDGADRPVVRFSYKADDQDLARRWKIFTGDPDFKVEYMYRVRVVVKGSIFTKGMEWVGPWNQGLGNGPLMVSVPTPDDVGVTRRMLSDDDEAGVVPVVMPPPPVISTPGKPPASRPKVSATGAPPSTREELGLAVGMVEGYNLDLHESATDRRNSALVATTPPPSVRATQSRSQTAGENPVGATGRLELVATFRPSRVVS
jgi:hypothetical protein